MDLNFTFVSDPPSLLQKNCLLAWNVITALLLRLG